MSGNKIFDNFFKPIVDFDIKPKVEPQPPPAVTQPINTSRTEENSLQGNLLKFKLQNANPQTVPVLFRQEPATPLNLTSGGIFADGYEGIEPIEANYVSPYAEDARPEEAASFLKYDTALGYSPGSRGSAFAYALEIHKNDPEWTKNFLREVGKDKVAEYISDSFHSPYLNTEQLTRNSTAIRTALETAVESGELTLEGMTALVGELKDGDPYAFTEIFAKSEDPEFKKMFIQASINNGDNKLEAAAAYVLNTLPSDQQEQFFKGLSDTQLNSFIEGAMAGQFEVQDLSYKLENSNAPGSKIPMITIGGVSSLVSLASIDTGYNGGSTLQQSPFSTELKERLFIAVNKGLKNSEAFEHFKDDKTFKDGLSKIFISHGSEILHAQAADGAFTDSDFISGMVKFFEMTLFTPNGGYLRDDLMQSVVKTMSDVGDASKAPPISEADYAKLHGGWSQQDHVEVMGGLMGMVLQAASNQKTSISNEILQNEAARKEMIGFMTGMAFCFLPGAGDIIGKIAGEGASFLQQIPDKIINYTFDQGKSQVDKATQEQFTKLLSGMNNNDALKNINIFIDSFKRTVVSTNAALPNGEKGELNLRTAFQSAFAFYGDLVRF